MKDRLDEFKKKLADLMEEYKAYITADDEYTGYPECGEDIQIKLNIDGETIDGLYYFSIEESFGHHVDAEKLRKRNEETK